MPVSDPSKGKVRMVKGKTWKSGTAIGLFTKPRPDSSIGQRRRDRVRLTENVSAVDALVTSNSHQWETPEICAERENVLEIARMKKQRPPQNVPSGTIDLGSFEVLSDHGDEMDVDDSTYETTRNDATTCNPIPGSRGQKCFAGSLGNLANEDHQDEEYPFLDCWDGTQEQFDALQQMDPWARNAPKSEPDVKGCFSVNLPVCSVCVPEAGSCTKAYCQSKRHSMTSPVKEKTDRATTPMMESGGQIRWT